MGFFHDSKNIISAVNCTGDSSFDDLLTWNKNAKAGTYIFTGSQCQGQTERAKGTALALLAIFITQSTTNWERRQVIICIFIGLEVPLG